MTEMLQQTAFHLKKWGRLERRTLIALLAVFSVALLPLLGLGISPLLLTAVGLWIVNLALFRSHWVYGLLIFAIPLESALPTFTVPILGVSGTLVNVLTVVAILTLSTELLLKRISLNWSISLTAFSLFVLWSFVRVPSAVIVDEALFRSLLWLSYLALYICAATYLSRKNDLYRSMRLFAISGWLLMLTALAMASFTTGRLEGPLGNPNRLATVLISCSLGVFFWSAEAGKMGKNLTFLRVLYLSLLMIVIFLTASRGGLVASLVLVLSYTIWERASGRILFMISFLVVIAGATLVLPDLIEPVSQRFQEDSNIIGARITIWETSFRLIQERVIVGYGAGNSTYLVGEALQPGSGIRRSIHNPLLQIWFENGLIGLLLYLTMIIAPVLGALRKMVQRDQGQLASVYREQLQLALISFGAFLLVWIKDGGATYNLSLFLFLAVFSALPHINSNENSESTATTDTPGSTL
jgi:O-antigen ligase